MITASESTIRVFGELAEQHESVNKQYLKHMADEISFGEAVMLVVGHLIIECNNAHTFTPMPGGYHMTAVKSNEMPKIAVYCKCEWKGIVGDCKIVDYYILCPKCGQGVYEENHEIQMDK